MDEWPWRYWYRSKAIRRDPPCHASDHLCLIWKEPIQKCRTYWADTECRMDGRTDRQSERNYPPTTSLFGCIIMLLAFIQTIGFRNIGRFPCYHDDVIKWKHFPRNCHLCGEFTGPRWIPRTKASDAELWCFFDLRLNKWLSKQSWGWRFETLSRSLWRHRND